MGTLVFELEMDPNVERRPPLHRPWVPGVGVLLALLLMLALQILVSGEPDGSESGAVLTANDIAVGEVRNDETLLEGAGPEGRPRSSEVATVAYEVSRTSSSSEEGAYEEGEREQGSLTERVLVKRESRAAREPKQRCCRRAEFEPLGFVSEHWRSHEELDPDRIRFRMLGDLVNSERLLGMHAEEVQEVLGPLDRVLLHTKVRGSDQTQYYYPVTEQRYFDVKGLVVVLDGNEIVIAVRVRGRQEQVPYLTSGACPRHEW